MKNFSPIISVLALLAMLVSICTSHAARVIHVQALFSNKAVVSIDGVRHVLTVGKPGPDGVQLISATSREAVLEVDGKRSTYLLGNQVSTNFTPAQEVKEQIWQNNAGMYTTVGSINGFPVEFLVDTGATLIAMNSGEARRLGIDYRLKGKPAWVTTASGRENAYHITLEMVKVGNIQLRNVAATVLEGEQPARTLLGMSFLGRLKMENSGAAMVLIQTK